MRKAPSHVEMRAAMRAAVSREDGAILVELAVIISLTVLIVVCLTDYGTWVQRAMMLQNAVNSAAAYGAMPGHMTDTTGMAAIANYDITGSINGATGVTVQASSFYTCSPGGAHVSYSQTICSGGPPLQYVQVTASMTIPKLLGLEGVPERLTLPASAIYRVQGTP